MDMMSSTARRVRGYLKRGTLRSLARRAAVSHSTLIRARDSLSPNMGVATLQRINAALDAWEQAGRSWDSDRAAFSGRRA